jgi:hypothetical protein
MIATARTVENSGFGTGGVSTAVYWNWTTGKQRPSEILEIGDGPHAPGDTVVAMKWLSSTHLELAFNARRGSLGFQVGWPKGDYLDPQPLASGNVFQNQAYGNYVFGVYMASAGVSLNSALSGANAYAFLRSSYPSGTQMDPNYGSLPAANVANITNGYNAVGNGTVCHN